MTKTTAIIATEHGSRYLQQLCKHWAHKFVVEFTPAQGSIDMGEDRVVTMQADANSLTIWVETTQDKLAKLEEVVAAHIERFAFREELAFNWQPA